MVMEARRLNELYGNPALVSDSDIDMLEQLAKAYPYYDKPFVVLAKAYFDQKHFRYEDSLRQAAIRVKNREWLYDYIYAVPIAAGDEYPAEPESFTSAAELPPAAEPSAAILSVNDFLGDSFVENKEEQTQPVQAETILHADTITEEITFEAVAEIPVEMPVTEATPVYEELPDITEYIPAEQETEPPLEQLEDNKVEKAEEETVFTEYPVQEITLRMPELGDDDEILAFSDAEPETRHFMLESAVEESVDMALLADEEILPEPFLKPHAETEPTPEMDFFSWLDKTSTGKLPVNEKIAEQPVETKGGEEKQPPISVPEPPTAAPESAEPPRKKKSINIIEQFISHNPAISRPKKEFFNPENMAKRSEQVDLEIVTETLAAIYYEHGSYDLALAAYEKLRLQNPGKEAYFASLIEKIKQEKK